VTRSDEEEKRQEHDTITLDAMMLARSARVKGAPGLRVERKRWKSKILQRERARI
jgi:hypothetical protein